MTNDEPNLIVLTPRAHDVKVGHEQTVLFSVIKFSESRLKSPENEKDSTNRIRAVDFNKHMLLFNGRSDLHSSTAGSL